MKKPCESLNLGYQYFYENRKKKVYFHRHLMEQKIGRKLENHERVHHKNGIKTDNRIENLELTTVQNHARIHLIERTKNGLNPVHRMARDWHGRLTGLKKIGE